MANGPACGDDTVVRPNISQITSPWTNEGHCISHQLLQGYGVEWSNYGDGLWLPPQKITSGVDVGYTPYCSLSLTAPDSGHSSYGVSTP